MALTADQVFDKIGSFGRFQLLMLLMCNILEWFWFGWPVLLMTFIAAEPSWRCVNNDINQRNSSLGNSSFGNSSLGNTVECPLKGTMSPGGKNYNFRCSISRKSWEFDNDYTSVVTQVFTEGDFSIGNSMICSHIWHKCHVQNVQIMLLFVYTILLTKGL